MATSTLSKNKSQCRFRMERGRKKFLIIWNNFETFASCIERENSVTTTCFACTLRDQLFQQNQQKASRLEKFFDYVNTVRLLTCSERIDVIAMSIKAVKD